MQGLSEVIVSLYKIYFNCVGSYKLKVTLSNLFPGTNQYLAIMLSFLLEERTACPGMGLNPYSCSNPEITSLAC
jgi:hypothetical protein